MTQLDPWNNGKEEVPRLDLTSSTTPGQQIHKFDHTQTANLCDWLPCRRAALLLVGCPHSLLYLHLPVVEGLIFCISATPHLGTSFPLHSSMHLSILFIILPCLLMQLYSFSYFHFITLYISENIQRHIVTRTHLRFTAQHGENIRILRN